MMIEIVPARASHLRQIAATLRQADRDEIAAMSGMSPLAAIWVSYRRASMCEVALVDGVPAAIWGVGDVNILAGEAAPWLLGSDAIETHSREFLRRSRDWPRQLLSRYYRLRNFVDCRNVVAIRWLAWLGFRFSEPFEWRGHQFMAFEMRADDVR